MFKHILIPLDGSRLAESALSTGANLANMLGAWVTLVHVIEQNAPAEIHGERHLRTSAEAETYLREISSRKLFERIRVEFHVHTSEVAKVARSIAEHVREIDSDLIVMCTHGRSGLRDWLFGNIAQRVISARVAPVLVVPPNAPQVSEAQSYRQILVPLDGQTEHEQGLQVASELASVCGSTLHLLVVVPTPGALSGPWTATRRLLPGTTSHLLDMDVANAEEYLRAKQEKMKGQGISTNTKVSRGDPAEVLAAAAQKIPADLIILGTHGRTGMDAFWSGSLPPKLGSHCNAALLLVPVKEPSSSSLF